MEDLGAKTEWVHFSIKFHSPKIDTSFMRRRLTAFMIYTRPVFAKSSSIPPVDWPTPHENCKCISHEYKRAPRQLQLSPAEKPADRSIQRSTIGPIIYIISKISKLPGTRSRTVRHTRNLNEGSAAGCQKTKYHPVHFEPSTRRWYYE